MSEQEEDFAAMFEASVKARRFERGQTVQGVIAGFGPKVAFVSIGGKSEAQIDLEELKDDEGDVEVSVGDRIEAMVVIDRRRHRALAQGRPQRRHAARARGRVPRRAVRRRQGREGGQGRIRSPHRPRARLLPALPDRHRPHRGSDDPRGQDLRLPHHRVQGRRQGSGRLAPPAPRVRAEGEGGGAAQGDRPWRGPARPGRVGAGFRRLHRPRRRHPGPAPRLRDELVAAHQPRRDGRGRRSHQRQGAAGGRGLAEDSRSA